MSGKGFSMKSFYGKNRSKLNIECRLLRQQKQIRQSSGPKPYKPRLDGPSAEWKIFRRQKYAFDFIRKTNSDLHVFSFESPSFWEQNGRRLYLVAGYHKFYHFYSQLSCQQQHHYEVIPEGAACHLYFDLEFLREYNETQNGVEMTEIFIKYVCAQLFETFDVECDETHVLQLDATTHTKYSRHLVFHLNNTVFKDNINAGNFVHDICKKLMNTIEMRKENNDKKNDKNLLKRSLVEEPVVQSVNDEESGNCDIGTLTDIFLKKARLTSDELSSLLVTDAHGNKGLFCDLGVYTKNRNFRLYKSCKLGKQNPLLVASNNSYHVVVTNGAKDEEHCLFMASLVSNVRYRDNLRVLSYQNSRQGRMKMARMDTKSESKEKAMTGYEKSPYPEVDDFISSAVIRGGVAGYIRHWVYFADGEILTYDIARNRWCENVGRMHKSNNIIMIADLRQGIYYQKCHDPQCREVNFKSQERPLPRSVLPGGLLGDDLDLDDLEESFGEVPDDDLLAATLELETMVTKERQIFAEDETEPTDEELLGLACEMDPSP